MSLVCDAMYAGVWRCISLMSAAAFIPSGESISESSVFQSSKSYAVSFGVPAIGIAFVMNAGYETTH